MFNKVYSGAVLGVDGTIISVESDVNDGLPTFTMVGYLSSSVREAGERVRTALKNSGYNMPPKRITINLSPANIKKEGSGFDAAIAMSIILSMGVKPCINMEETLIVGELSLDGTVKPVTGILPMVHHAGVQGFKRCIVPYENRYEAGIVKNVQVIGLRTLREMADYIKGISNLPECRNDSFSKDTFYPDTKKEDFSDIRGQEIAKRGLEIGAAGFHNIIMTGAPGGGKSMMARRISTILPPLSFDECMEVTKIYSISGLIGDGEALISQRPFRNPHHTISVHGLAGGGVNPKPGEISLAHKGVLFLDELPEFKRNSLEIMRQPMEDRKITISRVGCSYVFPADFMLVATMNSCPCGHFPNMKRCKCTSAQIKNYQNRISGPLMDRIDINLVIKPVLYEDLFERGEGESSKDIRERVNRAALIQKQRYREEKISFNSQLDGDLIKKYAVLTTEAQNLLESIFSKGDLSVRGTYRIIRLARTIADLCESSKIESIHLKEAVFYRNKELLK